ncbi:MAG TPA: hypothetical protein DIS53_00455 [Candidatus Wildermuthbacteria bacterium]|uniref:Uncharacterized protein n=1 Tax=Candidatus Yanofskybacteria bacterium GW2011_GWC1_48_11 TaxID=1619027 RepID=A0A837IMD2_9BACT|nr:MAG: hypothetical protein UY25_C0001G0166 [Candidatus Yanofskybacteria bacterium GW2011_GWC1_48_11]KKW03861.1 MAG: hypothetical protein UY38_C0002G0015 [Parcubacteria group bacterium GW2011_GWB1_49_12]KKW08577.1 MAG: hypothetical protein UY45_C0006G0063 [Parcubacteria group bacterium GW2011_GWA1_49_26]KKW14056.1 MAG: hypothetical protein UY53_C0004G0107 [Parcubacteria group bacterium GW2011_GWA2_50_10]OHA61296.1 MAG: hypothetical protein A2109_03485 [Candidatus Wildermuthbacteria bacterium G
MTTVPTFSASSLIAILVNIGDWIFVAAVLIAPVMVLIGAVMLLTGGDNPQRLASAKKLFLWTAIGFGLALLSRGVFAALQSAFGA